MPLDGGEIVSIDKNYYNLGSYISLFPNPSSGRMNLEFHGKTTFEKANVRITNLTGNALSQFDWNGESTLLDFTNYSKGVYFVKISVNDFSEVRKVVIQ